MSNYFDEIEQQLVERCNRGAHHRASRRLPLRLGESGHRAVFGRFPVGSVFAVASTVAVALGVFLLAVSLGHHDRRLAAVTPAVPAHSSHHSRGRIGTRDGPAELFDANPEGSGQPDYRYRALSPTVRFVETLTLPGAGRVQYWTANATHHGICLGLRLANGEWAGLTGSLGSIGSGPVPGCIGRRDAHSTGAKGDGFFWFANELGRGCAGGRVVYGIAPARGGPVTVRDSVSGATASVIDHRYFAIVIPPPNGRIIQTAPNICEPQLRYQLETLSSTGRVVAQARSSAE